MIGPTELVFVLFLLVSLYFVLKPPAWYNKSKKKAFISQYGGIVEQKKFRSLVAEIGLTIARAANYPEEALDFQVLKSPIPNAFAWNSEMIFVTMGLLDLTDSKDELAAVLAHEIGHLAADHLKARVSNRAKSILVTSAFSGLGWVMGRVGSFVSKAGEASYSREQEREADRLGVSYLRIGGYDPSAAIRMLEKLHTIRVASQGSTNTLQELLSTHPVDDERIASVKKYIINELCA